MSKVMWIKGRSKVVEDGWMFYELTRMEVWK